MFGKFSTNKFGLGDFLCSVNLPYICEEETAGKLKSIPTPEQDNLKQEALSLEGYELIPHLGYYKYHQHRVNWQKAVDICAQEGAHLLILNSEKEERAVISFVNTYRSHFYTWTGVHDQYEEGTYVTIFSKYCIGGDGCDIIC